MTDLEREEKVGMFTTYQVFLLSSRQADQLVPSDGRKWTLET